MVATFLLKFKKELIAIAIIAAMASSIYVMNLKIDNLELKLKNNQVELALEKNGHLDCKLSLGEQNEQIIALKLAADIAKGKVLDAQEKAADVKLSHQAEIDKLKGETVIKSCDEGMNRLRDSL